MRELNKIIKEDVGLFFKRIYQMYIKQGWHF